MTATSRRNICIVTGSRAEYGLMYWLMKEISSDPGLKLQVIATGMHMSAKHGLTYKTIVEDGFHIDATIDMKLGDDSPEGVTKSLGHAINGFAEALKNLKPEIMVVLGDRYEILAAAQAAMIARIPIAHLHGGELTEGLIDEAIRHSVTKMSHIHFVANDVYRKRVIQLGEQPSTVINVGTLALDNIRRLKLLDREAFEGSINFKLGAKTFLVTYHPVTLVEGAAGRGTQALFEALDRFPEAHIIFTKPNSDVDGNIISELIDGYVTTNKKRAVAFTSLGQLKYLSAIQLADVVIGNSSSGLVEVPAMKRPTVNIGDRQRGRLMATSVISCQEDPQEIFRAITKALSPDFQNNLDRTLSPYRGGEASIKIKEHLKKVNLDGILFKRFFDVDFRL